MDIILYRFHTILPPLFHKLNDKLNENDKPAKKGKRKGASNGSKLNLRHSVVLWVMNGLPTALHHLQNLSVHPF